MKLSHVVVFCLALRALYSIHLDANLPGGVDTASHLFKAWSISQFGMTYWSPHWYIGFPLISHYSPALYLVAGALGTILSPLMAYKIFLDVLFVATPMAFLSLLREIEKDNKVKAIALLIFSLSPVYIYYLYDGRHPAMAALFFGLLFWKYIISYGKTRDAKSFAASSFMLALAILTHHLTALFVIVGTLGYFSTDKKGLFNALWATFAAFLISSPWSIPFLAGGLESNASRLISPSLEAKFASQVISSSYIHAYSHAFTPFFVGSLGLLILFFIFPRIKERDNFAFSLASLILTLFIFSYNRAFVVLPIPLSILAARGMKNSGKPVIAILILLLVGSYHMTQVSFPYPDVPSLPKNERIIFLSQISENAPYYESYLVPYNGAFYATGWHPESQSREKTLYNLLLASANTSEDLFSLMQTGGIGYAAGDDKLKRLVSNDNRFFLTEERGGIYLFEIRPKPSFAELNGEVVDLKRVTDGFSGKIECERGIMIIKESYNPSWKAKIGGKDAKIGETEYGFMKLEIENTGKCSVEMKYYLF